MSVLRSLFGPSEKERIWRQIARRRRGEYVEGGFLSSAAVQAVTADWIVTLDTYSQGDDGPTYTRLRAPYVNPDGLRFRIYRKRLFSGVGKLLGMQDLEVGDPFFDEGFIIQGSPPSRVLALLDDDKLRTLIQEQPKIRLEVRDDEGWFGARFPEGVDMLYFEAVGVLKDFHRLERLFELFAHTLRLITHDGIAYQDDLDLHLARLRAPGGRTSRGKLVLWDGDIARRNAAMALGHMGDARAVHPLIRALADSDLGMRARAAEALGRIGDADAIAPLLPMLGDARTAEDRSLAAWAGRALEALGEGAVVQAVRHALAGDRSQLDERIEPHRRGVVRALVTGLATPDRAYAAAALQEIRAVEAIAELRAALRASAPGSRDGIALAEAVAALEAHSSLPRPADAPAPDTTSLPRPATPSTGDDDRLPRPAAPDPDEVGSDAG